MLNLAALVALMCLVGGPMSALATAYGAKTSWIGFVICFAAGLGAGFAAGLCSLWIENAVLHRQPGREPLPVWLELLGTCVGTLTCLGGAGLDATVLAPGALALIQ